MSSFEKEYPISVLTGKWDKLRQSSLPKSIMERAMFLVGWSIVPLVTKTKCEHFFAVPLFPVDPLNHEQWSGNKAS